LRLTGHGRLYRDNDTVSLREWAAGNPKITGLKLPSAIDTIKASSFSGGQFKTLELPANLKIIEERAFADCKNFTTLTLPASVTDIGGQAFFGSNNLTRVTFLGETAPAINTAAFAESLFFNVPSAARRGYGRVLNAAIANENAHASANTDAAPNMASDANKAADAKANTKPAVVIVAYTGTPTEVQDQDVEKARKRLERRREREAAA
jgi:hypothetical protein